MYPVELISRRRLVYKKNLWSIKVYFDKKSTLSKRKKYSFWKSFYWIFLTHLVSKIDDTGRRARRAEKVYFFGKRGGGGLFWGVLFLRCGVIFCTMYPSWVNFDIKFVRLLHNLVFCVRNCSDAAQKLKTNHFLFRNSIKISKQSIREKILEKFTPPLF